MTTATDKTRSGGLVPPHGGRLNPLFVGDARLRAERLAEAEGLPSLRVTSREASDIIMLATGSFSPLAGFMGRADYEGCVEEMRLSDGTLWPIPVTLAVPDERAAEFGEGRRVALREPLDGAVLAILTVSELFTVDRRRESELVYRTDDKAHPGVASLFEHGGTRLAGTVEVLSEGGYPERFPDYARPAETRALFAERGWSTVAAFQTRNPIHRSHEYLTKVALEVCDGLLIHPVVGRLKDDDVPAEIRMRCYQVLLERYYPRDRVLLKVYPMEMRYAGPREALLHAIIRQNFGCSHLIVGRDHAGVGSYYGPFDAQRIFDSLAPADLHIKSLKLDWTFWCRSCGAVVSARTCPHPSGEHLMISGTRLREMLSKGERPPVEFSRPEVVDVLMEYYASR